MLTRKKLVAIQPDHEDSGRTPPTPTVRGGPPGAAQDVGLDGGDDRPAVPVQHRRNDRRAGVPGLGWPSDDRRRPRPASCSVRWPRLPNWLTTRHFRAASRSPGWPACSALVSLRRVRGPLAAMVAAVLLILGQSAYSLATCSAFAACPATRSPILSACSATRWDLLGLFADGAAERGQQLHPEGGDFPLGVDGLLHELEVPLDGVGEVDGRQLGDHVDAVGEGPVRPAGFRIGGTTTDWPLRTGGPGPGGQSGDAFAWPGRANARSLYCGWPRCPSALGRASGGAGQCQQRSVVVVQPAGGVSTASIR